MNHTQKSYSNHIKKRCLCPLALTNQGDFIAGFSLVAIHYFHVSLGSGDALVRHVALDSTDISTRCRLRGIGDLLDVFITNGDDIFCLCLLSVGMDAFSSGCKVNDFFPSQCENIAYSQTC